MEDKSSKFQKTTRFFLLKRIFPEKRKNQVSLKQSAPHSSISTQYCPVDATTGLKKKILRVLFSILGENMSAFCCEFLLIPGYIHMVEQSWSTQTGLLSDETKTGAGP